MALQSQLSIFKSADVSQATNDGSHASWSTPSFLVQVFVRNAVISWIDTVGLSSLWHLVSHLHMRRLLLFEKCSKLSGCYSSSTDCSSDTSVLLGCWSAFAFLETYLEGCFAIDGFSWLCTCEVKPWIQSVMSQLKACHKEKA